MFDNCSKIKVITMALTNTKEVRITIQGNDFKNYTYDVQPQYGLFEVLSPKQLQLITFQIGTTTYWYKEAHHTPASAAHRIKKAAELAAPGVGMAFGLAGVIVGLGAAAIIEQFPTQPEQMTKEGYYSNGHLVYYGKVVIDLA